MADKTVTTCASMLVAFFQKQRQRQQVTRPHKGRCSCLCHTYNNKHKNLTELTEMNDNKFFNCKCNHDCGSKLRKDKKRKTHKKIVKFQIEHTGSMSSLASPNRATLPNTTPCDKLRNTLSLCKMLNGRMRNDSIMDTYTERYSSPSNSCCNSFSSPSARRRGQNFKLHVSRDRLINKHQLSIRQNSSDDDQRVSVHDQRPKSFYEWTIPFENIELGESESTSSKGPVYRGRWHGDVMIYTRPHETQRGIEDFQNEVALLGLIRHENVVLFMGACIEPPNLAVVTSVRKGQTLHTHLHVRMTSFHFGSKFSIAKQIAQGMGYLHAKGITLGKLCSRNIFLESKVKIGITDYTMSTTPTVKKNYGCIPKGHLTYLSPELMRAVRIDGVYLSSSERTSQKSDVFAYGTVLFEIFLGRYPFKESLPEVIIWAVSTGNVQSLDETDFPLTFKCLIQSCWANKENNRPEFQDILSNMRKFNIPRSLQKKLSLSDSGAINKQHAGNSPLHRLQNSPTQPVRWKKTS